jgi:hypothetical protein
MQRGKYMQNVNGKSQEVPPTRSWPIIEKTPEKLQDVPFAAHDASWGTGIDKVHRRWGIAVRLVQHFCKRGFSA